MSMTQSVQRKARGAMKKIETIFQSLGRAAENASQYMEQVKSKDGQERKTAIDALRMAVLQMGEAVARMERLQQNFWNDYTGAMFPKAKQIRNRLAHTDDMSDTDIMEWANENLGAIRTAIARTEFGKLRAGTHGLEWSLNLTKTNELPLSEQDEPATTENSVALIYWESSVAKYLIMRAQSKG